MTKKGGTPSRQVRFEVFKRDLFRCRYCGRSGAEAILQLDHVFPKALGGGNAVHNYVTACDECNAGKGDRPLDGDAPVAPIDVAHLQPEQARAVWYAVAVLASRVRLSPEEARTARECAIEAAEWGVPARHIVESAWVDDLEEVNGADEFAYSLEFHKAHSARGQAYIARARANREGAFPCM